ncbi:OLC1v1034622C1 [Oldenlandia corymbosa var. corymbosa]|uniref:OLC1v1034622C1 n=1 Tax=Oldenlandia corymbosa var. corymbosa TaxID=529605 RepID=A0AAV1CRS1_OLDCO|nr:OLC1v1034622C1 [Oldenlandia corymbosa var. corymbosa]
MSKMKTLSKPLSSPSRTDKFPTPLMLRFLRSNVGSRSRGRSRSSPLFILRSKKNAAAINEAAQQQEPSSPKVTCIGQVRARRSSKAKAKASRSRSKRKTSSKQATCCHPCSCSCPFSCSSSSSCSCCCCFSCCVPKTLFCCHFRPKFRKPRLFPRKFFRKWVYFFRFGYCKKIDVRDDSVQVLANQRSHSNHHVISSAVIKAVDIGNEEGTVQESKEDFHESSSFSPPKNALLLTRCRSAPYRSSSLAGKFWESPLRSSETETETLKDESKEPLGDDETEALKDDFRESLDYGGNGQPNSPINEGNEAEAAKEMESRNSISPEEEGSSEESRISHIQEEGGFEELETAAVAEQRISNCQEEEGSSEELECSTNEKTKEDLKKQESRGGSSVQVHPLLLMRCKSEPAKTGERLNPEVINFSKQRRSDTSQSCLQDIKLNCD